MKCFAFQCSDGVIRMSRGLVIQRQRWGNWKAVYAACVRSDVANIWRVYLDKIPMTYNQRLTGIVERAQRIVLDKVQGVNEAMCVIMRHQMRTTCVVRFLLVENVLFVDAAKRMQNFGIFTIRFVK